MLRATELAHLMLRRCVRPGDWVVDATAGNGHDTLFLAGLVGPEGRVFGFDVQEAALAAAAERIGGLSRVTLIHAGHEEMSRRLPPEARGRLAAVMFNLGYLPGGTRDIATRPDTTLAALDQALAGLRPGGAVTLVLYSGHQGGAEEAAAVRDHAAGLPADYCVARFVRLNAVDAAPELVVIERRGSNAA